MQLNLPIFEQGAPSEKTIQVSEKVFGCEFKEPLVHQVIIAYLAGARAGTRGQKTRAEVSGSGKKPWKQKGTGQARAGCFRSPIWRGGGVTFAAKNHDYTQKVNKKMYTVALRSIFSELMRQNRLLLVESFNAVTHKTKEILSQMKVFGLKEVLIITDNVDKNLHLATRNLHKVSIREAGNIDPLSLVGFEKVLVTVPALRQIEEMLK